MVSLCVGYLGLAGFLTWAANGCSVAIPATSAANGGVEIEELIPWANCLSPSEVGDWLAGIFAPLAFILLGGTVFLQSLELIEQRNELEETRDVFRQQARLIEEQVREAKRSGDLFEKQTEMAAAEARILDEKKAAEDLNAETNLISNLPALMMEGMQLNSKHGSSFTIGDYEEPKYIKVRKSVSVGGRYSSLLDALNTAENILAQADEGDDVGEVSALDDAVSAYRRINDLLPRLSLAERYAVADLKPEQCVATLEAIRDRWIKLQKKCGPVGPED